MTTLFNLFCPFIFSLSMNKSVLLLSTIYLYIMIPLFLMSFMMSMTQNQKSLLVASLFPSLGGMSIVVVSGFFGVGIINLFSLVCFSYPLTTTLSFNLSLALSLWLVSTLFLQVKNRSFSNLLPVNTPWYLVPFLCLVEAVSIGVRPVTLCFRLLANMSAGHILLSLICKMNGLWILGTLFGILELMVCMVQAFVFLMLVAVYLDEAMSH